MLSVAYQASWNSLTNYFSRGTMRQKTSEETEVRVAVTMLLAKTTHWRIWTWLTFHVLLTFAASLLVIVENQSSVTPVREPEKAALLLDTSGIFRNRHRPEYELDPPKPMKRTILKLVPGGVTGPPRLIIDNSQTTRQRSYNMPGAQQAAEEDAVELLTRKR